MTLWTIIGRGRYFLLGVAFGLTLAVFHAIASEPEAGFPYQTLTTNEGLKCVVFFSGPKRAITWGTCNWDEYNFRQWHSAPPLPAPSKGDELPI